MSTLDSKPVISTLFSGYSFYLDGLLGDTTRLEMVELVRTHGGEVEHFFSVARVNVIVAENLSYSKMEQMKKVALLDVIHGIEEHCSDCEPPVDFGFDTEAETAALYAVQLDA